MDDKSIWKSGQLTLEGRDNLEGRVKIKDHHGNSVIFKGKDLLDILDQVFEVDPREKVGHKQQTKALSSNDVSDVIIQELVRVAQTFEDLDDALELAGMADPKQKVLYLSKAGDIPIPPDVFDVDITGETTFYHIAEYWLEKNCLT